MIRDGDGGRTRRQAAVLGTTLAVLLISSSVTANVALAAGPVAEPHAGASPLRANAAAADATIVGTFEYNNSTGFVPGRQVRVALIHDRGVRGPGADPNTKGTHDRVIANTTTNDSGGFEFTFDPSSVGLGTDARVYVMVIAANDAAVVTNTAIKIRHGYASDSWWLNPGDTITPTVRPDSEMKHGAFHAADAALTAYRFTDDEANWTQDQIRIQYPQTNSSRYISITGFKHISLPRQSNDDWDNETVYHEYGHSVMGTLFGGSYRIPHIRTYINFNQGFFPCHNRASDTGRFYAWNEGFAGFFEAAVARWSDHNGAPVYRQSLEEGRPQDPPNQSYTDDPWFNNGYNSSDCLDGEKGDGFDGNEVEGALASILWDVYDGENEPYDEMNASLRAILGTMSEDAVTASTDKRNRERARTGHEFWKFFRTNDNHEALRKIYYRHGIQKPDRFEPNDDPSDATAIVPNTSVDAQFQNQKITEEVPSGTVPNTAEITDEDYYEFSVREEQRVNVTLITNQWVNVTNVSATVRVTGPAGKEHEATERGDNATVTFTANESGTHTLHVDGIQSRKYTGWYTLEVNATPQVPQKHEENDDRSEATSLSTIEVGNFRNTTETSASTARHDPDYYNVSLRAGHRIEHARLRDAPGLTLTLLNDTGTVATVSNDTVLNTTTEPEGEYYFVVDGDARVQGYTLNVTTRLISQKYEENDRKAAAADLGPDIGLEDPPKPGNSERGSTTSCNGNGEDSDVGGGVGNGVNAALDGLCPRHNWQDQGEAGAGYAPHEDDWYSITLRKDERVNVSVTDDRLGVELYHDGAEVADTPASDSKRHVIHHARSAGTYYINVTGDEYVPSHRIRVERYIPEAADRLEPNDDQATASRVTPVGGSQPVEYDLLKLAGNDEDYFAVSLDRGDTLNATLTHLKTGGTVNLSIVTPAGHVVNGSDLTVGPSTGGERTLRATETAQSAGTYYVRVSGSRDMALKYNLTIVTNSTGAVWSVPSWVEGERVDRFEYDDLDPGRWHDRDVPTPEELARAIAFEEIGVNPDTPLEGFAVAAAVSEQRPDGVPAFERQSPGERLYLLVGHDEAFEGSARVRVSVSRDALADQETDPDRLAVYRHPGPDDDGEWEQLRTDVVETDDTRVVLEAESAGLSVYTVGIAAASCYAVAMEHRPAYNRNVEEIPDIVGTIAADERITVEVASEDGETETVGIVMEGKRVNAVRRGGLDDPTLVVRTTKATVRDIENADDPSEKALAALENDRISYHGVGILNSVKFTAVDVAVGVMEFFGDVFGVGPFG